MNSENKWEGLYSKNKNPFGSKPQNIIFELLKYKNKGDVLDLGCGEGQNILFLAKNRFKVVGIDISETAIKRCLTIAKENKVKVKCILKSVLDYKIDKEYDIITTNYFLHLLNRKDGLKLIKQIKKHTKKRGINIISSFFAAPPFYGKKNKEKFYLRKNELKRLYKGWKIKYYKEDTTKTFAKDKNGKPFEQKRVIMLAQKLQKSIIK